MKTTLKLPRRRGPQGATIRYAVGTTSLGQVLIGRSSKGLCALMLGESREPLLQELAVRFPGSDLVEDKAGLSEMLTDVIRFLEVPSRGLNAPLDPGGTPFQQTVWKALCEIPAGSTTTYTDIAVRIGRPQSVRAVAHACAANPLAVVVPCHRVVGRDGKLRGYRWGLDRKQALLDLEAGDCRLSRSGPAPLARIVCPVVP